MIKALITDLFKDGTVTAKSTETNFASSNVQDSFLKRTWRSTGVDNEWIKFDLGSAMEVDMVTFHNNNLTTAATVNIFGNATDLGADPADWLASATFSATSVNYNEILGAEFLSSSETLRYWLIEFDDPTNTNGYVEIGRVFSGLASSTDENFNENFNESTRDRSRSFETEGINKYSVLRAKQKVFSISLTDMDTANQNIIENWFGTVGKTNPFVLSLDSDIYPLRLTRYGKLESDLNFSWSPNDRASTSMTFAEEK